MHERRDAESRESRLIHSFSNYLFRFLHFSTYYDFKKLADLLLLGDINTILCENIRKKTTTSIFLSMHNCERKRKQQTRVKSRVHIYILVSTIGLLEETETTHFLSMHYYAEKKYFIEKMPKKLILIVELMVLWQLHARIH